MTNSLRIFFAIVVSVSITVTSVAETSPLATALDSNNEIIRSVVANADEHELQILLTVLDKHDRSVGKKYKYRVNAGKYFYPASTIKFPMALFAAEFISQHPQLEIDTPYSLGNDKTTYTVLDDIRQIFAISDDAAYNRLYELIGRDQANQRLYELGYPRSRIAHRLAVKEADAADRTPIKFYASDNTLNFDGQDKPIKPVQLSGIRKGEAYFKSGTKHQSPFDFSYKNLFPIEEQHQLLHDLIFDKENKFKLGEHERETLLAAMQLTPAQAGFNQEKYFDGYAKFFLYGDNRKQKPDHIKIYNKVGYAYGSLTDNAYIKDEKNKVAFLLSATLLVNKNKTFNDDQYEYQTVGLPFLAELGRQIHTLLLNKNK